MMDKTSSANDVWTLVLVGRTGDGKSATGNNILGWRAFRSKASSYGVTRVSELQRAIKKKGPIVNVIDTPGLYAGTESVGKEIVKCVDMAKDGIHAVLMVFSVRTRFSEEEQATFCTLLALFGDKIVDYMIVIFTGGDDLEENEETLDDYLGRKCPEPLKEILIRCGNRKLLFDNKTKDEKKQSGQVQQLFNLVNTIITQNGGRPYTNELFREVKEKATMRDRQKKEIDSLKGYSKQIILEMKEQLQQKYDDELKQITNVLKEEIMTISKKLEEERVARLMAEENFKTIQVTHEIEKLKLDVERTNRRINEIGQGGRPNVFPIRRIIEIAQGGRPNVCPIL